MGGLGGVSTDGAMVPDFLFRVNFLRVPLTRGKVKDVFSLKYLKKLFSAVF